MTDTTVTEATEATEVEATEATGGEPTEPAPEATDVAPTEDPATEAPRPVIKLVQPVPAQRTGNAAWPADEVRTEVQGYMAELRAAGYTRPELQQFTEYNDSTVWRAQNGKVHATEVDTWRTLYQLFANGTLPAPAASLRKPKVADLQAKIERLESEANSLVVAYEAKLHAITDALSDPGTTVKQYKAAIEATLALIRPTTEDQVAATV